MNFKYFEKYPWKNKKEREIYYDKLGSEDNHYNREKYKDLLKLEYQEELVIKKSYLNLFEDISLILLILMIFIPYSLFVFCSSCLILTTISLILYFKYKINRIEKAIELIDIGFTINMLFAFYQL